MRIFSCIDSLVPVLPSNIIEIRSVFLQSKRNIFGTGRKTRQTKTGQKPRRTRQKTLCFQCSAGCGA